MRGGASLCPQLLPLTFDRGELDRGELDRGELDRGELQGSLIAHKISKMEAKQENTQKFQFDVQKELFPENTFFDLPPTTVGTLAHHTHIEIC